MLLDQTLFTVADLTFSVRQVLSLIAFVILLIALWRIASNGILPRYFEKEEIPPEWRKKIRGILRRIFLSLMAITFLKSLALDRILYTLESYQIRISSIFLAFIVIEIARILDWLTSQVLIHKYYTSRDEEPARRAYFDNSEAVASRTVKYMVYTLAGVILISVFNLNYELFRLPINERFLIVRISSIFIVFLIFLLARLLSWAITQLLLYSYYRRSDIDAGRRFAINQLVTYVIYVIAVFVTIDNIGLELTVLWGGIAALLVGVGLGLQDVFRDLVSGIILLSDRSVNVHDIVQVEGRMGEVYKIGLRTSLVLVPDETMIMVPNSQLVSSKVINWTHQNRRVRFAVQVGVAYGSDPDKIREILLEVADNNSRVLKSPKPFVRFQDFGDSALVFDLFFWSSHLMTIEDLKSSLRFGIAQAFAENKITIPFPQRDIWIRGEQGKALSQSS